jgi:hypothetical protein
MKGDEEGGNEGRKGGRRVMKEGREEGDEGRRGRR